MYDKELFIEKRRLAIDEEPYFIADVGANHDGSLDRAFKLIELAKESGADAVKFQNFIASKIVSKYGFENLNSNSTHQSGWKKSVYETYEDASISQEWTKSIVEKCAETDITYFTSPYDFGSVDHVEEFLDVYKIGSGDITWLEILEYIAKKNKTVLLASGAASMEDVDRAVGTILSHNPKLCLMQCNTNYSTDSNKSSFANLNVLRQFSKEYPGMVLGLSDHSIDPIIAPLVAIGYGAKVIEKHFTLNKNFAGPDHSFALNPEELKTMIEFVRKADESKGIGKKEILSVEKELSIFAKRSLQATTKINKGDKLELGVNFEILRPGKRSRGIDPRFISKVNGKKSNSIILNGNGIRFSDIEN